MNTEERAMVQYMNERTELTKPSSGRIIIRLVIGKMPRQF